MGFLTKKVNTLSFDEQREEEQRAEKLHQWFLHPQGIHLANAFALELMGINSLLRGEILLQLGHCGENPWLSDLKYSTQCIVSPCLYTAENTLRASFLELPFEKKSVDAVLMPLSLECFDHKKNPLDEVDRVLKPFGFVIFFGIQPLSIWGLWKRLGKLDRLGFYRAEFFSSFFLKRLLMQRGYLNCYRSYFYYIPPVKHPNWLKRLEILNHLNKLMSPYPAGFFCFIMQKHVLPVSLQVGEERTLTSYSSRDWQPACPSLGQNSRLYCL